MNLRILVTILIIAISLMVILPKGGQVRIRITTTTNLYATGILDYLVELFKRSHPNVGLEFIAVGGGEALRRAENGDACMFLVHAPSLERRYPERAITGRHIFSYNYFIIAGPSSDPAHLDLEKRKTFIHLIREKGGKRRGNCHSNPRLPAS